MTKKKLTGVGVLYVIIMHFYMLMHVCHVHF